MFWEALGTMLSEEDRVALHICSTKLRDIRERQAHASRVLEDHVLSLSRLWRLVYAFGAFCSKFDPKYWAVLMQVIWGAVVFFMLFSGWLYYGDYRCFVELPFYGINGVQCLLFDAELWDVARS